LKPIWPGLPITSAALKARDRLILQLTDNVGALSSRPVAVR
jgi:hypothetical protein